MRSDCNKYIQVRSYTTRLRHVQPTYEPRRWSRRVGGLWRRGELIPSYRFYILTFVKIANSSTGLYKLPTGHFIGMWWYQCNIKAGSDWGALSLSSSFPHGIMNRAQQLTLSYVHTSIQQRRKGIQFPIVIFIIFCQKWTITLLFWRSSLLAKKYYSRKMRIFPVRHWLISFNAISKNVFQYANQERDSCCSGKKN